MNFDDIELFDLQECPYCGGAGYLDYEGGWCCYVECADCGAQTPHIEYKDDASRTDAENRVVFAWNQGKVISFGRGE